MVFDRPVCDDSGNDPVLDHAVDMRKRKTGSIRAQMEKLEGVSFVHFCFSGTLFRQRDAQLCAGRTGGYDSGDSGKPDGIGLSARHANQFPALLYALSRGRVRLEILLTASASEEVWYEAGSPDPWRGVGPVAYFPGLFLLHDAGQGGDHDRVADHYLSGAWHLFRLGVLKDRKYMGAGDPALFE